MLHDNKINDSMNKETKDSLQSVGSLKDFIFNLKGKYKDQILRAYNNSIYLKNKEHYKRLGYNQYLEKDSNTTKFIIVPVEFTALRHTDTISAKHIESFQDDKCKMYRLEGTETNVNDFIKELKDIHKNIYDPSKSLLLDIPMIYYNMVVGRNGIVLYKHENTFKIKIGIFEKKKEYFTLIVHGDNRRNFKDYILNIIYEDII